MSWTCLCIVFVRYFAFTHIHQGYITGTTRATIRCQWISSELSRLMLLLSDISTYCKIVAWWCQMATCNLVIIVSCNGLLPLPLPMLTYHERSPLPFIPVQCLLEHLSEGQWVKLAEFSQMLMHNYAFSKQQTPMSWLWSVLFTFCKSCNGLLSWHMGLV